MKSGYIALIGKPNVGKSTLMNALLQKKISIVTSKPQTTRHRILGIKTTDTAQMVFVDTPGLHHNHKSEMNRAMNRVARTVLHEVDIILFIIEAMQWNPDDDLVLRQLKSAEKPVILVVNKIDRVKQKEMLLPFIDNLSRQFSFAAIVPISAKNGLQLDALEKNIIDFLPDQQELFPAEQFTDQTDRMIASEFVREQLMTMLGDELPYAVDVEIELFEEKKNIVHISALIVVNKDSHKPIVIGEHGSLLKKIGTSARRNLENYFAKKIMLKLWVRVK